MVISTSVTILLPDFWKSMLYSFYVCKTHGLYMEQLVEGDSNFNFLDHLIFVFNSTKCKQHKVSANRWKGGDIINDV